MAAYHVVWEIDIDAQSPNEAVILAWEYQQGPHPITARLTVMCTKTGEIWESAKF